MSTLVFFSIVFFLLYTQASIYILWRNPNAGINYWFSILLMLFAIWSLSYVFSGMGEIAQMVFDHKLITLTGFLIFPSFYFRIASSIVRLPKGQTSRNVLFVVVLMAALPGLFYLYRSDTIDDLSFFQILQNADTLLIVSMLFFLLNTYIFIELQIRVFRPKKINERILQHLKLAIIFCDQQWRINYVNPYALTILQHDLPDIQGRHVNQVLSTLNLDSGIHSGSQVDDGKPVVCTIYPIKSGAPIMISFHILKLFDEHHDYYGMALIGHELSQENDLQEKISNVSMVIGELNDATTMLTEVVRKSSLDLAEKNNILSQMYRQDTKVEESLADGHAERDLLIKEIHDRAINNMRIIDVFIDRQMAMCTHDDLKERLGELSSRIRSISLVYKHLYFSLNYSLVDFKSFIQQLLSDFAVQYNRNNNIRFTLSISDHFLDVEKAIPLGMILNELLMNCFAHAFPKKNADGEVWENPEVLISYAKKEDEITLIVRDNGIGANPQHVGLEGSAGGLALVEFLVANQLGGQMSIASDDGMQVTITCMENGEQ